MKTIIIMIPCLFFFLFGWTPISSATTLWPLEFTGHIEEVDFFGDFPSGTPFNIGDSFTGNLTYDLDVVDLWEQLNGKESYPNTAFYRMNLADPYYGIQTRIGEYEFSLNPGDVLVWDNETYNLGGADRLDFINRTSYGDSGVVPILPFDMQTGSIEWTLQDPSMLALGNQALPIMIDLAAWEANNFNISGSYMDNSTGDTIYSMRLKGRVDSVRAIDPVPEPTTLFLLGVGLFTLAARFKRSIKGGQRLN